MTIGAEFAALGETAICTMNTPLETPKQVLVGIYHLDHVGGAELYTIDLLKELHGRDDVEVEFFAINGGRLSDYVKEDVGISFMSKARYDLILATHNVTVDALRGKGPLVQICHGAILALEQPSAYADYHVGITQEVCDNLEEKDCPNQLVLNGLDLEQKQPVRPLNSELKTVLSLCQSEEAKVLLERVCEQKEIELLHYNKHKNPTFNVEEEINKADMVVGIGRSVYDAMACGRPCIVFDSRDYNGNKGDGYLHPDRFDDYVVTNCSGRYRDLTFAEDDLLREFGHYNPEDGRKLRQIAEEKLNVKQTATELLQIDDYITGKVRLQKMLRVSKHRFLRLGRSIKKRLPRFP